MCSLMLHLCDMNWPLWHSVFLNCSCNADLFPPNRALKYFKVPSKGPVCVNTGSSCVSPGETAVRVPSWVWSKSQWGETKTDKKADWAKETSQTQQAENNTLIIISVPAVDALELIRRTKPRRGKVCYAGQRRPVKLELNPTVFTGWFQTLWHFFKYTWSCDIIWCTVDWWEGWQNKVWPTKWLTGFDIHTFYTLWASVMPRFIYYTALLNAAECSIHLDEPSQRSAVSYFRIIDRC